MHITACSQPYPAPSIVEVTVAYLRMIIGLCLGLQQLDWHFQPVILERQERTFIPLLARMW